MTELSEKATKARKGFRMMVLYFGLFWLVCLGIWAVTGQGYFWPAWVLVGYVGGSVYAWFRVSRVK